MKARFVLLVALLPAALGCKKESPATPATPPTPTPAAAAARKDPLTEVPRTDSTLSLLEPQGGKCQWSRQDPPANKRAVVAAFDGDCKGGRIAWSPDKTKALVWFDPSLVQTAGYSSADSTPAAHPDEQPTPGAKPRLYEVTLASGDVRTFTFPTLEGELLDIGYTAAGVTALTNKPLTPEEAQAPITVDGKQVTITAEPEGVPSLIFTYRLQSDGSFKRVEARGTYNMFAETSGLGLRSAELLDSHMSKDGPEPTEAQAKKLLGLVPAPLVQKVSEGGMPDDADWAHGETPAGSFFVWRVMGDTAHTMGHLVFEREGNLVAVKDLGFTEGEMVSVTSQGPFVLVSAASVGTHPRMYDLRTGKSVFSSDTVRATTFWPAP